MWSSVRRYRGRSTRDDDISINCSCITDWCFTWCGNQCSKKHEQRTSVCSQTTNDSDQSQDSKCCTFGGCCVQTSQIRRSQQTSQVLTDSQMVHEDRPGSDGFVGAIPLEAERQKTDATEDVGYWAYLRRFRPRFFNRSREVTSGVVTRFKKRPSGPSRFNKLAAWLQQLQPRFRLPTATTQMTASSSASHPATVHGEHVNIETIWSDHDLEANVNPMGTSHCNVFTRGRCGYESFNSNCCNFLPELAFTVSEIEDKDSEVQCVRLSNDENNQGHHLPDLGGVSVLPEDSTNTIFEHNQRSLQKTSVTVIEVTSDVGGAKGDMSNIKHTMDVHRLAQQPSKQTQIHAETGQSMKDIVEIEKVNSDSNNAKSTSTISSTRVVLAPIQSNTLTCNQFHIPEVVLSRASTPLPNIPEECAEEPSALVERSPRTPVFKKETNTSGKQLIGIHKVSAKQHLPSTDIAKGTVKVDIVNYMTKSSTQTTHPSATGGRTDATKKIVRFKEPTPCLSTTKKGKAVYIGTFKHTTATKRGVIDCISMTMESRCVTVSDSAGVVENPNTTKTMTSLCTSGNPSGGIAAAASPDDVSKGVKEYVNEYSQLCKSSVDQEREILQTVIDSVREYYKMPEALEEDLETSTKAGPFNK